MEQKIEQVLIDDIIPNRFQPRLSFDSEGLKELSESIKQHGIIQPLVLRRLGNKYEIIAGERRFKAAQMAGLKKVPAIISNINDNQSAEIALVENIQRRNLTSIEEAKSYRNLLDRGYMTQEQLAEKMGVSQSSIANKLRLLNLSQEVQDALLQEKISERHARSLLAIPKEEQNEWLKKIIAKRMTVRQLDLEIKKAKGEKVEEAPLVKEPIEPKANEEQIAQNQILPVESEATDSSSSTGPNKFFNFLENEAANMNVDINPIKPAGDIEVLDDFDLMETPSVPIINDILAPKTDDKADLNKPSVAVEEDEITPFFFKIPSDIEEPKEESKVNENPNLNNNMSKNNNIEEVVPVKNEVIVDPLDSILKLDPEAEIKQQETQKTDLKVLINDVRDFIDELKEKGFEISLEELDLDNNYQITINIQK